MSLDPRLVEKIRQNDPLITSLNLKTKALFAADVLVLANALKSNTTVTSIDLSFNSIFDAGAKTLANVIETNGTLTSLDLRWNEIYDTGATVLLDALQTNTTLTTLNLWPATYLINNAILTLVRSILARNQKISAIKAAWTHPIKEYSHETRQVYLTEIKEKLSKKVEVGQGVDEVITAILVFRTDKSQDEDQRIEALLQKMNEFLASHNLNLEQLPDHSYPKKIARLLTGKIDAKNVEDADAQVNALMCFAHPFADTTLGTQARSELIGLLNNAFFAGLAEHSLQRRSIDALILMLSCQYPQETDLMRFALAAHARLVGGQKLSWQEADVELQNPVAVVAVFKAWLSEAAGMTECTPDERIEKCLEKITEAFTPKTMPAPNPGIHGLFQPAVVSKSPDNGMTELTNPARGETRAGYINH